MALPSGTPRSWSESRATRRLRCSAKRRNILTINPTWNVPPSIIRNEYLPALERDPTRWSGSDLRVGHNHDGSLRVYQPPGERNALGRIRFNFPNQFLVYQHYTPNKKLFAATGAHSATAACACRAGKICRGAAVAVTAGGKLHIDRIQNIYGDQERAINLKQPIPVHATYQTAFVDKQGELKPGRHLRPGRRHFEAHAR